MLDKVVKQADWGFLFFSFPAGIELWKWVLSTVTWAKYAQEKNFTLFQFARSKTVVSVYLLAAFAAGCGVN